jgi:hypothetical protein
MPTLPVGKQLSIPPRKVCNPLFRPTPEMAHLLVFPLFAGSYLLPLVIDVSRSGFAPTGA